MKRGSKQRQTKSTHKNRNNQNNRRNQQKKQHVFQNRKILFGICVAVLVVVAVAGGILWRMHQTGSSEEDFDATKYVTLGEYVGVTESLAVTEEDLQDEIDTVLEDHAEYEQLSGTTQDGDTVYADFEGYVDGQRVDSTCGSDYVELGSGDWLDGFESSLTGVNTGEEVSFLISVPEGTYGDETVDGREVEFHATVEYICGEEILPEYTDEFVQSISKKYSTTEEYTEHLKTKLRKENEEQKAEYVWSDVVDAAKVIKYPKSLMKDAKKEVLQGYYDMAVVYGCTKEEIFPAFGYESEQAFKDSDLKPLAKDTAKEYLISAAIAQTEGITYTQEQYDTYVEDQYSGMTDEYDSKEAYEKANKTYLKRQVLMEQVKQWLSDHAKFEG
jgi:trigger factor